MDEPIEECHNSGIPAAQFWWPLDEYGFCSPWAPRLWRLAPGANYITSIIVTLMVGMVFLLASERCRHWCLLPLMLCGILSGSDIVSWLRKEIDTLDPKAIVAAHIYLTCSIGPLLHLAYGIYGGEEFHTSDWPRYFGFMACFNFVGIILFKLGHNFMFKKVRPAKSFWRIKPGRFAGTLVPVMAASAGAAAVVKLVYGGLVRDAPGITYQAITHLSWLLMLGDPAVMLVMMVVVYWVSNRKTSERTSFAVVVVLMIAAMVLQFMLVGMRGSRSVIVVGVAVVAAMIHYRLRPFSVKLVLVGMYLVVTFVYLYGFYKFLGTRGLEAFYSKEARKSLSYELGGASVFTTALGRGKADLQAFILYNLMQDKSLRQYALGKTYAWTALYFVPRAVWKTKPIYTPKMITGTIMQGQPPSMISSRVYGLGGEAMLNFGYWGIPPAFFVFGSFLGWFRKKIATMEPSDSRFFVVPFLLLTCAFAIGSDFDNMVFGLLKMGTLPFAVVFFGSERMRFVAEEA